MVDACDDLDCLAILLENIVNIEDDEIAEMLIDEDDTEDEVVDVVAIMLEPDVNE